MKELCMLLMYVCLFISCEKNEENDVIPLKVEREVYSRQLEFTSYIPIQSGSGSYHITPEDPEILTAAISYYETQRNQIVIIPHKKGKTNITIQDNISNQEKTITIHITDSYIPLQIKNTIDTYDSILKQDNILYLIKDENNRMYIYNNTEIIGADNYLYKGNYKFETTENSIYLILYPENENQSYRFCLAENQTTNIVKTFFNLPGATTIYENRQEDYPVLLDGAIIESELPAELF